MNLLSWSILVLGAALLGAVAARSFAGWWAGRRLQRRMARARALEAGAADLLAAAGYRVIDQQAVGALPLLVDEEPIEATVRADYLVQRGARRFVVEVKSGSEAPNPAARATRRQLLEYAVAWRAHGLLLLDAESGRLMEVRFPGLAGSPGARWGPVFGFAAGTLVGAGLAAWWVRSG